jgi:acyl carrier protein
VEREQLLSLMKVYFADLHGPERVENFESLRASDLVEDSVDAITFVMFLEDKTDRDIPLAKVGPAITGLTFQELAGELCRLVNEPC